jgi:1,4-dihydroxy-2-naphthoate octaprenyltransferase/chlorophyll synthase
MSAEALSWLPGFTLLSFASAVASGLSDEESDRAGGKKTLASVFGNGVARRAVEICVVAGLVAWLLVPLVASGRSAAVPAVVAVAVGAVLAWPLRLASPLAVTGAWDAQRRYKAHLHRSIWGGVLALAVGLVVSRIVLEG